MPNPSTHAAEAVGTPSVAEASVLAHGATLIVEKQKTPEATCPIGRLPARGRLTVIGLGPGSRDLTTPRAQQAIREASVVVGYRPYVAQVKDLLAPGVRIASTPMGKEEERTATAIAFAREGHNVALVCSGDPTSYAMASPTLEQGTDGIEVEIVPGVTASLAASAILGAPLGHDHATISLSDLHTDWRTILRRVRAAAEPTWSPCSTTHAAAPGCTTCPTRWRSSTRTGRVTLRSLWSKRPTAPTRRSPCRPWPASILPW